MPWKIQKRNGKHCVIKEDGSTEKCHMTRADAVSHMRALYASEKELSETEEKAASGVETTEVKCMAEGPMHYVPYGVTSFSELKAAREADEASMEMSSMAGDLQALLGNRITEIMEDEATTDKPAAIVASLKELAGELAGEVAAEAADEPDEEMKTMEADPEAGLFQRFRDWLRSTTTKAADGEKSPAPSEPLTSMFVWKEADRYRWLAVFSNKYRDRDNPPEILADAAHKEFVEAVDKGEWPMPELWHWHVPGSRWGVADWLAYDEASGFPLASGWVDAGHEKEAEALAALDVPILTSHGMPKLEIYRDANDPTIITRYRSKEVSDLPGWAAANPLTGFQILKEVQDMAIPDAKKQYLRQAGLTDERITQIEADLDGKAKEASDQGLESKEAETEVAEVVAETEAVTEAPLTRAEVAEAMLAMNEMIGQLRVSFEALESSIKALKESDAQKIADKAAATPAASLMDLVRGRAVGAEETRIDGRSELGRSKPKETKQSPAPISVVPFLNDLVTPPQQ